MTEIPQDEIVDFKVYRRGGYLVLEIEANKSLLETNGSYFTDYYNNPSGLTLLALRTGIRYSIPMIEREEITPETPHDVFRGYFDLELLEDDRYEIEGYVRSFSSKVTLITRSINFVPIGTVEPDKRYYMSFTLLGGKAENFSDFALLSITPRQSFGSRSVNVSTGTRSAKTSTANRTPVPSIQKIGR